jgi:hypothetical protein
LAGIALEKIVNPAVNTKAELKNASFFIERLLVLPDGHVARIEFRRLSSAGYSCTRARDSISGCRGSSPPQEVCDCAGAASLLPSMTRYDDVAPVCRSKDHT